MRKALPVVLLLLMVAAVLATAWNTKSQAVMTGARDMLEQEVANALGSSVSVGTIDIQGLSSVAITNVVLFDKQGAVSATADRVSVTFNPISLLTGSNPADAIHTVSVEKPSLYLRQRSDMGWNIDDFIQKPSTGSSLQFGGDVRISQGKVSVETQRQGSYHADNINGTLDFSVKPSIQLDIKGYHNGSWFTASGSVNGRSRDAVSVSIDNVSLPAYQAFLPSDSVQITAGQAKHVTLTVLREKEAFSFSGEAVLGGLAGQADGVSVTDASALVSFDQDAVRVYNGDLTLWGQQLRVGGKIVYQASEPVMDLVVAADSFAVEALPLSVDWSGVAAFSGTVQGTKSDLSVQGELSLPTGRYQSHPFNDAAARFVYTDGLLQLNNAQVTAYGGRITANGIIDTINGLADLRVSGRQLDGRQLALSAGIADTGANTDFELLLRGGSSLTALDAAGSITLGSGQASGVAFSSAYGSFRLHKGILTADYLNAAVDYGLVSVKGSYDIGNDLLAIDLEGQSMPLAALTTSLPEPLRASGTMQFTAKLTGKIADPQLALSISAEQGSILAQPFERLTGTVAISRDSVVLQKIAAVNALTTHTIDGSIQLTGQKNLNLAISTRQARMEALLKALPVTEVVTGNVDHDITVTGTLDNPSAEGILSLTKGSYRGYLLTNINGSYRYRDGMAELQNVVINSLDNQLIISGTAAPGSLSLAVTGNDIDLSRLPFSYPYPISGKARVTAYLTGTLAAPQFSGQAIIPQLTANGQTFDSIEAFLNINGSQLECPSATFRQGQSTYALSGGINGTTKEIYGSLQVERAKATAIAALIKSDSSAVTGELNGRFTWNGTLENPGATFNGTVKQGVVKGYALGDIELDASLANHVINLEKLMVTQSTGLMAAKGQIDLRGDINIEAGARDIDAAFFSKLFDSTLQTSGKLSFTAQVSGKTASPHTAVSLEIANGTVAQAGFDNLYGLFIIDKGKIQVEQILLSKGEYKASAYGVIPLAALNKTGRSKASASDQMDMTFRLDHADLRILPIMTKAISAASGETKGEIKVTGNLFDPDLNGQITVKDGTVKFADLAEPIQKVTVDIQFKNDKIQVRAFEGTVGTGKYLLAGTAAFRDMALTDYDMSLTLDNVLLTHKYFKGPVSGNLTLTEKENMPYFTGKLLLANTIVNVPIVPLSSEDSTLNFGMDVELLVGDKVRLYNPALYDVWVAGKVHFAGTLQQPDVSGKIEALRGTLNYLQTRFRIHEAAVAFTQFRSFEPVLTLRASTRLAQTDVTLAVNGPVTAMELQLASNPQMSQQEILSLLTLRGKITDRQEAGNHDSGLGRDELVGMLGAGLQLRFFSEIEDMFRNTLGVDEFRVFRGDSSNPLFSNSRAETEQDQYKIEIGKYVTDRLLLRYSTGVDSSDQSYGARYDITNQISLSADITERDDLQVGIGMRFRF